MREMLRAAAVAFGAILLFGAILEHREQQIQEQYQEILTKGEMK